MNKDDPITLPPLVDFRDVKTCKNCGEEKKLSQFYKNKHMVDGHVNVCITCKVGDASKGKHNLSEISGLLQRWATNANQRCDDAT